MNLSLDRSRVEEALRKANTNSITIPAQKGKYTWISEVLPEPRRGSIIFEAKSSNDIKVCLHDNCSKVLIGKDGIKDINSPEYEIVIGGWGNTKSVIRKFCSQQIFVTKEMKKEAVIRTASIFVKYWITIIDDIIYVGVGELGYNPILQWKDENSTHSNIQYIGVSSWNMPVQFKNFTVTKPFIPDHQKFTFNGRYLLNSSILSDRILFINNEKLTFHSAILYCWNPSFFEDLQKLIDENDDYHNNKIGDDGDGDDHENGKHVDGEKGIQKECLNVIILKKLLNIIYSGRIESSEVQEVEEILLLSKRLNLNIEYLEQFCQSLIKEINERKKLHQLEQCKLKLVNSIPHNSLQAESNSHTSSAQRLLELRIQELSKNLDLQFSAHHHHPHPQNNNIDTSSPPILLSSSSPPSSTPSSPLLNTGIPNIIEVPTNNNNINIKLTIEEHSEVNDHNNVNEEIDSSAKKMEKLNTILKESSQWNDPSILISRTIRFSALFCNTKFSDVEFIFDEPENKTIVAHRSILSILSDPLMAMFSNHMRESTQKQIKLSEVNYVAFLIFLEYCYKGNIEIPVEHVISLLILSDRFGINPLRESCFEIVNEYIDLENCCNLLDMADLYNWATIKSNCFRFIESNFNRICEREEFLLMLPNTLIQILLSDDLLISDEYQVFVALMKWIQFNCPSFSSCNHLLLTDEIQLISDFLQFIRFPLMNENMLLEIKETYASLLPLIPSFRTYIDEAINYVQKAEEVMMYSNRENNSILSSFESEKDFRKRNRTANNFKELLYSSFGDKNGVFYYIGCAYGTKKIWENPHKANRVKITMSSPVSRYTKADILVNRSFVSTNYTSGNPAWFKVDLKESHQLVCNYYTIRQDGSDCFIRHWILQGSNHDDDDSWVNLRIHKKDKTIFQPSQYAGWSVFGKHAKNPYRYFRIITTGPSTGISGGNHKLAICGLELYGFFK